MIAQTNIWTSYSVDEMAAVARGEDPDISLFGMQSPRSRYVAAERARAAEVRFVADGDTYSLPQRSCS